MKHEEEKINKAIDLFLSIEKSEMGKGPKGKLDTSKLVRKPVQVVGKDGKTFTRMQWVKPYEAEPIKTRAAKEDVAGVPKGTDNLGEKISPLTEQGEDTLHYISVSQKPKQGEVTQLSFINDYIRKLEKEERIKMLEEAGVEWERHNHPNINTMKAFEALREYLLENPDKIGAGHLPQESKYEKTPDGTDKINVFYNKVKKKEVLYEMLKEAGIGDGNDPRESGDPKANVEHMKNIMAFKKFLKKNPEVMDDPRWELKGEKVPTKKKKQSKAQKGGNTIEGVLDSLSEEEKGAYIRKLGISSEDLATVRGARRMELLNQLKLKIILDPSILNKDPYEERTSEEETERIESLDEDEALQEEINHFFGAILGPTKEMLIDEYQDEKEMVERPRNAHPNIDHKDAMVALKKLFKRRPELLEEHALDLEDDLLAQLKITNKQMEKVLRNIAGIRGAFDVKIVEKDEELKRTVEWEFLGENFARIQRDGVGNWVLDISYLNEETDEYDEKTFELADIKDYVEGLTGRGKPIARKTPLHEKGIDIIQRELNKGVDAVWSPEIEDRMAEWILNAWRATGKNTSIKTMIGPYDPIRQGTLFEVLDKMGIKRNLGIIHYNDTWNEKIYKSLIDDTKEMPAQDYIQYNGGFSEGTPHVLVESAKRWTPEERNLARKDLAEYMTPLPEDLAFDESEKRPQRYREHIRQALLFVPFDILAHLAAKGTKIKLKKTTQYYEEVDGRKVKKEMEFLGANFNAYYNHIEIAQRYIEADSIFSNTALENEPKPKEGDKYQVHPLSHAIAHEMGHCIDNFFSNGGLWNRSYLDWSGPNGKKFLKEEYVKNNPVTVSYNQVIGSSNPQKTIGVVKGPKGNVLYYYHRGNWIDTYEARIYNKAYAELDPSVVKKTPSGNLIDVAYRETGPQENGLEHWAHSVARFADARTAYLNSGHEGSFEDWSNEVISELDNSGVSSFREARSENLQASFAKEYQAAKEMYPHMSEAIASIFDRGDFVNEDSVSYTEQVNATDSNTKTFIRKSSENLIIYV